MNASNQLPKVAEIYGTNFCLSLTDAQKLHERAEDYFYAANYREGIRSLESALQMVEKSAKPNERDRINILATMAEGHMVLGEMEKASSFLKRGLAMAVEVSITNDAVVARILKDQALINLLQGDLSQAPTLLSRCLEIQKTAYPEAHPAFAPTLQAQALLLLLAGNYADATASIEQSSVIIRNAFGRENVMHGQNLNLLAMIQWKQGDIAAAASSCERSIAILEQVLVRDHPITGQSLNTLGLVYQAQGECEKALSVLKRNLGILEKTVGTNHLSVAMTLKIMGLVCLDNGDPTMAISYLARNLSIYEKIMDADSPPIATTLNNIALAHLALGHPAEAEQFLKRCLAILLKTAGEYHPEVANCLHNLAGAYHRQGKYDEAAPFYNQSLKLTVNAYGVESPKVVSILGDVAMLALDYGKPEMGLHGFRTLFRNLRPYLARQYSGLPSTDALKMVQRFYLYTEAFHSVCANATAGGSINKSLAGAEELAVNKALLEEVQATRCSLDADPATETKQLLKEKMQVEAQLDRLAESSFSPALREETRRSLDEKLTQVEEALGRRFRLVAQAMREQNLDLVEVARSLPENAVLLDFVQYRRYDFAETSRQGKETHYAAYLTFPLTKGSTNVVVERVDLGESSLIDSVVGFLCQRLVAGTGYANTNFDTSLRRLSELVCAPLARHLTNVAHLIVCPDGQLSRVPFEMLLVSKPGEPPRYLVEEKTISYVGSGREVARLAQPSARVKTNAPVVMGNPDFDLDLSSRSSRSYRGMYFSKVGVTNTEAEARTVAKLLGGDCVLRLGKDAREADLKAVVSPRVLHLATHGFFLTDQEFKRTNAMPDLLASTSGFIPRRNRTDEEWENPMVRCGIALAGANHARQITNAVAEDGLLTGLEASLLNLQGTELVILSACESGAGEVKIGEGVMSLRRAFRIAGAETVLASHWKVSDRATSQLMTEFMRRWRGGEPRAKAWREAQLSLLRTKGAATDYSNPFFWSAFTLTGQWR